MKGCGGNGCDGLGREEREDGEKGGEDCEIGIEDGD